MHLRRVLLSAGLPILLAACQHMSGDLLRFDDPVLDRNVHEIRAVADEADLIFVGRVREVGTFRPPGSGYAEARQAVAYDVDHVVRGFYSANEIEVDHLVVAGSRQADPAGGLASQIFAPGNTLIVFARRNDIFYSGLDENFGTIPYSPRNERTLVFNM